MIYNQAVLIRFSGRLRHSWALWIWHFVGQKPAIGRLHKTVSGTGMKVTSGGQSGNLNTTLLSVMLSEDGLGG